MKLRKVLDKVEIENKIQDLNLDLEIEYIFYDSRLVKANSLFVCLVGKNLDGHVFAQSAINSGALAIITEKDLNLENQIIVSNTRKVLAQISDNFFEHPSKNLNIIAITGTKGKTTTASFICDILNAAGQKTAKIGTLGATFDNKIIETKNTTPESFEIQKLLRKYVDNNYKNVVIEASSLGLKNHRLDNILINYAIFTNISNDHVGANEHENFEDYLNSKLILFKKCKKAFVNIDDSFCDKILKECKCEKVTFGFNEKADIRFKFFSVNRENFGSSFKIQDQKFNISIPGRHNVYNAVAAIAVCQDMKIDINIIKDALKNCKVCGRSEVVFKNSDFMIIIDYAHNDASMENILISLKAYKPKRLINLFGAGGNRERSKRFEMGKISGELADLTVITSDNSRFENTLDIISDIKTGMLQTRGKFIVIPDRKEAIRYCVKNAKRGDIILLAGKGHELYQEINGIFYHFDEREIVKSALRNLGLI